MQNMCNDSKQIIKEWLGEARTIANAIRSYTVRLECLREKRESIYGCSAGVMTGIRGSQISDPTERTAEKLMDKYDREEGELHQEIWNAEMRLARMKEFLAEEHRLGIISQEQLDVLYFYYFEGMSMDEVAMAVGYERAQTYRHKRGAINNMAAKDTLVRWEDVA